MTIMRVTKSFRSAVRKGARRGMNEGELVPASHPLVREFPQYFEPVEDYCAARYPDLVETTSAEPGTKRRRSKPKADHPAQTPRSSTADTAATDTAATDADGDGGADGDET